MAGRKGEERGHYATSSAVALWRSAPLKLGATFHRAAQKDRWRKTGGDKGTDPSYER